MLAIEPQPLVVAPSRRGWPRQPMRAPASAPSSRARRPARRRLDEDVDLIDLQKAKLPDGAPQIALDYRAARPPPIKTLGCQRHLSRVAQGKVRVGHRVRFHDMVSSLRKGRVGSNRVPGSRNIVKPVSNRRNPSTVQEA
jgi:hypothetical protein